MSEQINITQILSRWPSRQAIADDTGVDLFAVHRWFQRGSVPGKYDTRLLAGASARGITLAPQELMAARSVHDDQAGHASAMVQEGAANNSGGVA